MSTAAVSAAAQIVSDFFGFWLDLEVVLSYLALIRRTRDVAESVSFDNVKCFGA